MLARFYVRACVCMLIWMPLESDENPDGVCIEEYHRAGDDGRCDRTELGIWRGRLNSR